MTEHSVSIKVTAAIRWWLGRRWPVRKWRTRKGRIARLKEENVELQRVADTWRAAWHGEGISRVDCPDCDRYHKQALRLEMRVDHLTRELDEVRALRDEAQEELWEILGTESDR